MSDFMRFKQAVKRQCDSMVEDGVLFRVSINKEAIWELYLNSFPAWSNEIFRERTEHDCNSCKSFICRAGGMVSIVDNKIVSVWDGEFDSPYSTVATALSEYIHSLPVSDIFLSTEAHLGVDKSHQMLEDGTTATWNHLHFLLPKSYVVSSGKDSVASIVGTARDTKNVFKRSMDELTLEAGETILELIAQGALYRGDEHKASVRLFCETKKGYDLVPLEDQDNFCWLQSKVSKVGRIRNTALGTLLIDLSEGVELDSAVRKFEAVMAPANYKRPKAIFTKKMVEAAQEECRDLGFEDSLARRQATLEDINVSNVLFLNRDDGTANKSDAFSSLAESIPVDPKKLTRIDEVTMEAFIEDILPTTESIELLVEGKHQGNLVSLIAPENAQAPSMLKWNNNFSWSYDGDVADSMKQNVKAAGGSVDGALRFSIQWNDNDDCHDDLDAHCTGSKLVGQEIYFGHPGSKSSCNLDVDIINPQGVAVENITWPTQKSIKDGTYTFLVNCYSKRGGKSGFTAEIEFMGQIWSFSYGQALKSNEYVVVAKIEYSEANGVEFISSLDSSMSMNSKKVWGLNTNTFVPVSSVMFSPNYWDGANQAGNKHYMFFLKGCQCDEAPRGFFNEFLKEDLTKHKRVFEALGSKMVVQESENSLNGLGFSSTVSNTVVARVKGKFTRDIIIKI